MRKKKYKTGRYNEDPIFRKKRDISRIVGGVFLSGFTGQTQFMEIAKCTPDEFKHHIESQFEPWMNWNNKGLYNGELNYGWDIDHIIPMAEAKTDNAIILLNHYKNLRPRCSKSSY